MGARRFILRRLRDERGFALVLALAVTIVLGLSVTSLIAYTSSNSRTSRFTHSRESAYALAEAGLNNALSVLNASSTPMYTSLLPATTTSYDTGSATWSGTLDDTTPDTSCPGASGHVGCWKITSTGIVHNPSGAADLRKTLSVSVALDPVYSQLKVNEVYDYVFVYGTGAPSGCDFDAQQSSDFESRLYVQGNLCLSNSATVTNELHVWGTVSTKSPSAGVGKSSAYNTYGVHVKNGCRYSTNGSGSYNSPCGTGDHVWANPVADSSPVTLTPPDVVGSAKEWYKTASPGAYAPCKTTSGVLPSNTGSWATAFDGDVPAGSSPNSVYMNRSVPGAFDLTPSAGAYSCKTSIGELSWDPNAKDANNNTVPTLTVKGTVFIDGNARIAPTSVPLIRVVGVGTIYVSGSFVLSGTNLCAAYVFSTKNCDWALPGAGHWDVSKNFLAVAAGVVGGGGQSETPDTSTSVELKSVGFQGEITAANKVDVTTQSYFQGPLVEKSMTLGQSLTTYPFGTLTNVPTATPDNQIKSVTVGSPTGYSG